MKTDDWEGLLLRATETVREKVADLALAGGGDRHLGVGASGDKTMVADKVAEEALLSAIGKGKGVRVLSEEAGEVGDPGAPLLAVVDPLDGSSNFERGIPFYCTAVALVAGRTIDDVSLGVVRDLVTGDVYVGRKGGGSTKNGRPLKTSATSIPRESVVGIDLSRTSPQVVAGLASLVSGVRRQLHLGANALELCTLAEGRIDGFVDVRGRMRITDFAAAYLVAKEAGATITDERGGKLETRFDLDYRFSFVAAANIRLHRGLLDLCRAGGRTGRLPKG